MGEDSLPPPAFLAIWGKSDLGWGTVTETVSEVSFHLALGSVWCWKGNLRNGREANPPGRQCVQAQTPWWPQLQPQGEDFVASAPGPGMCPVSLGVPGLWLAPGFAGSWKRLWAVRQGWFKKTPPGVWLGVPSLHWRTPLQKNGFLGSTLAADPVLAALACHGPGLWARHCAQQTVFVFLFFLLTS